MRWSRTSRRRWGVVARGAFALGLAGLSGTTVPATGQVHAAERAADGNEENQDQAATITLDTMSPGTLRPDQDLKVTATVTAGANPVVAGSRMELWLRPDPLRTRYSVLSWATAGPDERLGSRLTSEPLNVQIPAHASRRVTLTVPAEQIHLPDQPSRFGPRAVALSLTGPTSDRLAVNHTYLVWYPRQTKVHKVGMSVIVPVTAGQPSPTTGLPNTSRMARDTEPQGRLTSLLSAADRPGVTLAVDPSLLVANGSDSSQSRVASWRGQLVKQTKTNQTVLLPSADPDVAALAHANQGQLLSTAVARAKAQSGGLYRPITSVAMPADGRLDEPTAGLLAANGTSCAVLRSSAQPTLAELGVTPSGRSRISFPNSRVPSLCGLLADDTISDVLAGPSTNDPDAPTGTAAVQRLLAESAAVAEQDPSASRQLLAVAPRQWNPGDTGRAQLNALLGQPWVSGARLSSLVSRRVPQVQRNVPTITGSERAAELPAQGIASVTDQMRIVSQTAQAAATGQDDVVSSMQQPAIGMVSQAWRGDQQSWSRAHQAFNGSVSTLRRAVRVVPGSSINQVSRDVRLPVTVQNDLDHPVDVRLHAAPTTNLLRVVNGYVRVRVPQHSRAVAYVSVSGVGSGDAQVRMRVTTAQGFTLDDEDAIRVRVRADWENRATFVAGGVFLCILVGGIVRTLHRGRTRADTIDPTTGESSP